MLLGGEIGSPACSEIDPPALRVSGRWGADLHRPTGVVSVRQAKSQGSVYFSVVQPCCQNRISRNPALQAACETDEGAGAVAIFRLGGPGTTMVNFP